MTTLNYFMKSIVSLVGVGFIFLEATGTVQAATLTFELSGIVTEVNQNIDTFGLDLGEKISGSFSYDNTKPFFPSESFFPLTSVNLSIGTFTVDFSGTSFNIASSFNESSGTVQISGSNFLFASNGTWSAGVVSGVPSGVEGRYSITPVPESSSILTPVIALGIGVFLKKTVLKKT